MNNQLKENRMVLNERYVKPIGNYSTNCLLLSKNVVLPKRQLKKRYVLLKKAVEDAKWSATLRLLAQQYF
jgi:hypothetical protein